MNKSLLILLSSLTMCAVSIERDETRVITPKLAAASLLIKAAQDKDVTNPQHLMAYKGLRGGGPAAAAWGYSVTKGACYTAVGVAATYAVVQTGGTAAPLVKVALAKGLAISTGSATAGEALVVATTTVAKTGVGAKVMGAIGTGAMAMGSYLPWVIEGVSATVGGALGACPFLP